MSLPPETDPQGVTAAEVDAETRSLLLFAGTTPTASDLERLLDLGDMQWHTYEVPSLDLRRLLTHWLTPFAESAPQKSLEDLLAVAYCFSLEADFFKRLLLRYTGEHRQEFEADLSRAVEGFIDPWWSLRE